MKKTQLKYLRLLFLICLLQQTISLKAQQVYVNKEWRSAYGDPVFNPLLAPYGGDWTKSIIAANGEVITVAHTFVSGQGENVLLTRFDDSGTPIWQVDYNSSSSYNDYGINLIEDSNGDIYVCGTTDKGVTNDFDVLILIFDSNGNLIYDTRYDGPDGKNDIPSGITLDGSGNIIIAGTSESNSTSYDYLVLSYDLSLNLNWSNTYDYNSLYDFAAGVVYNGKIVLAGASANSATDWDMTTVEFDESTGAFQSDNRVNYPGLGYDEVYAFRRDANDNTYITGKASSNGTNYNIRTAKIDSTNTLVWAQSYDAFGLEDVGTTLAVDANGNVIVGGFITKSSNNKKELIVLKYSSTGTLLWKYSQSSQDPTNDAVTKALTLNPSNGNIYFIGGDKEVGNNKRGIVGRINSNGSKEWERYIRGNYNYLPSDIQYGGLGANGIYAIAIKDSTVMDYELNFFTEFESPDSVVVGATKKYIKHETIIRFDKAAIKFNAIDNTDKTYGQLTDFIKDSTINKLDIQLNTGLSCADWPTRKIFIGMTTNDTLSQTRMGNFIKIPEFYCALLVSLPNDLNTYNTTNSISNIKPDIHYCELNYVGDLTSVNDPNYNIQSNIHPTGTYTAAHINADSAWVMSNGENHVKIGVFDTGIYKWHEEFDTINGLYFPTMSPLDGNDQYGHGTSIAGIIGAKRNNTKGIAGIAGGNDSISKPGISLYDCRISPAGSTKYAIATNALFHSSKSTSNGGFGIHVANNSFVWAHTGDNGFVWTLTQDSFQLYAEQINFANRNGVAYIGAKGNNNIKSYSFPADFSDEIQMSVGSSGNNGHWCISGFNCSHGSFYGGNIDFVAPGSTVIINSTATGGGYGYVGGTSHAAPHVSGAVGLMMSYYNKPIPHWDNLVHEDCESILKRTASDLVDSTGYGEHIGRDSVTGYGRINTYKALKALNKNYFKIFHIDETHYVTSSSKTAATINPSVVIDWPAIGSSPSGTYVTQINEVTTTLNYSFPNGYQLIDYWPLYKECRGWQDTMFIKKTRPFFCKIVSVSPTQAVLKTYYFVKTINGQIYPEVNAAFHKSAISLYMYDPNAAIGLNENLTNQKNFVTFPNPSTESFNVVFGSDLASNLNYKVYDLIGKVVLAGEYKTHYGKNTIQINMQEKSQGVYILNIYDSNKTVYTQKLIKQ